MHEAVVLVFFKMWNYSNLVTSFSRFGPAAVRRVSQTVAFNYSPYFDKDYGKMRIYDAGQAHHVNISPP